MTLNLFLLIAAILCAFQALRTHRLIRSALWLALVSAWVATLLYRLGAHQVAVIELSVGAGLVTVLFVFAIALAGEDAMGAAPVIPALVRVALCVAVVTVLVWLLLPAGASAAPQPEAPFAKVLWEQRGLDALVQIGLIFSGVLGVLGLLAPVTAAESNRVPVLNPADTVTQWPVHQPVAVPAKEEV